MGDEALREVPTSRDFAMDPAALREMIEADSRAGRYPFLLIGTAGTTGGGIVDPLADLADIASEFNLWFHVDAAWGGAAVLVPRLRPLVQGIERADSVTWDARQANPKGGIQVCCEGRRRLAPSGEGCPPNRPHARGTDLRLGKRRGRRTETIALKRHHFRADASPPSPVTGR